MPKRKREESLEDKIDQIEDRAVRIKASRLNVKIDHGTKTLKSAIQLAKGFERQKLGRRQKQAEKEPHTLLRLREEVIILKELNASKTAKDYLFKQLVKTKRIKDSPAFVAMYGENPSIEGSKSAAEGNVLGRLFKSNPVKEVLPDIMQGIRDVLGLREPKSGANNKTHSEIVMAGAQTDQPEERHEEDDFGGFSDPESATPPQQMQTTLNHESLLDGLELSTVGDADSEDDLETFEDRLAASSSDEHSPTTYDKDIMDVDGFVHERGNSRTASQSFSGSEDSDPEDSPSPPPPKQRLLPVPEPLTKTAFLPSLNMGGYYSGSESDIDDGYQPDRQGAPLPQPRKNRRGQRARQQIAEKKYGSSAKHLAKQSAAGGAEGKQNRNTGWNARRGAVDSNDKRKKFGHANDRSGRGKLPISTGANGDVVNTDRARSRNGGAAEKGTGSKKGAGPLHPSWEAAKKKKQQESGNAAFAGKKITFD